jgi:hypothetical protein
MAPGFWGPRRYSRHRRSRIRMSAIRLSLANGYCHLKSIACGSSLEVAEGDSPDGRKVLDRSHNFGRSRSTLRGLDARRNPS